jgi:hypothetical protein
MPLAGCCYRQQLTAAVLVASLRRATTDEYMHWQVDTASSSHDVLASLLRRRNSRVIATVAGWDTITAVMVARLRKAADPGSITHLTGLFYDCNSNRGSVLASLSAPPKQQRYHWRSCGPTASNSTRRYWWLHCTKPTTDEEHHWQRS